MVNIWQLWSYGSWIYNYLCNRWLSPLKLWVRIPLMAECTWYNIMWESLLVTCGISVVYLCTSVCSANKAERHDIAEVVLQVTLNTILVIVVTFVFFHIQLFIILQWLSKFVVQVVPYTPYSSVYISFIFELFLVFNIAKVQFDGK